MPWWRATAPERRLGELIRAKGKTRTAPRGGKAPLGGVLRVKPEHPPCFGAFVTHHSTRKELSPCGRTLGGSFGPKEQPEQPPWPVSPRWRNPSELKGGAHRRQCVCVSPYRPPRASSLTTPSWGHAHHRHGEEEEEEDEEEEDDEEKLHNFQLSQ